MIIRLFEPKDIIEIRTIHQRFYEKDFLCPEFNDPAFLGKYSVEDDFGKLILFGGVRLAAEAIAITDLSRPVEERREALLKLLSALVFTANSVGFLNMHITVNDSKWKRHLIQHGFKPCRGEFMTIDIS